MWHIHSLYIFWWLFLVWNYDHFSNVSWSTYVRFYLVKYLEVESLCCWVVIGFWQIILPRNLYQCTLLPATHKTFRYSICHMHTNSYSSARRETKSWPGRAMGPTSKCWETELLYALIGYLSIKSVNHSKNLFLHHVVMNLSHEIKI